MSLTLSVPFLMDVLSRVANMPINSDAPPLEDQQTLLEPLNVGQVNLLSLTVTSLLPSTLSITGFVRDDIDLTEDVAGFSCTIDDNTLHVGDQIDYRVTAQDGGGGAPVVSTTASFLGASGHGSWVLGGITLSAFQILASSSNGDAPTAFETPSGALQIGGTLP